MKKGLKITAGGYLNMDHIVEWWVRGDGTLHIATALADGQATIIVSDSSLYDGPYTNKVPVNELHRIIREISEYMGVDQKERLTSVK